MKKTSALIALFAVALLNATACGGEAAPENSVATDNSQNQPVTEAQTTTVFDEIGIPEMDYQGKEFTILTSDMFPYENIETPTGDLVDDTVYARTRAVEDLLNIKLKTEVRKGYWVDRDIINGTIRNSILADDKQFSVVSSACAVTLNLSLESLFLDVSELPTLDLSHPWWIPDLMDSIGINGKLYAFAGDSSLSMYKNFAVIYFNQKLVQDYSLESPYQAVHNNKWTFETFQSLARSVGSDLNGDEKVKEMDDLFGFIYAYVPLRTMQTALEFPVIELDAQNVPYVVPLSNRTVEIFNNYRSFMKDYKYIYGLDTADRSLLAGYFAEDRALFLCEYLTAAEYMRDMSSDFGIVPMPKYDESQKDYHTQFATGASMYFVPVTVDDPALTGAVCEAMAYYSYRDLIPIYYEVALKEKYTRDTDVKEMLDIIRSAVKPTFSFMYGTMLDPWPNLILTENSQAKDIASYYEKVSKKWETGIEQILEVYHSDN